MKPTPQILRWTHGGRQRKHGSDRVAQKAELHQRLRWVGGAKAPVFIVGNQSKPPTYLQERTVRTYHEATSHATEGQTMRGTAARGRVQGMRPEILAI